MSERSATWALMQKHFKVKMRQKKQTCCEVLCPVMLSLVLVMGWSFANARLALSPTVYFADQDLPLVQDLVSTASKDAVINLAGFTYATHNLTPFSLVFRPFTKN